MTMTKTTTTTNTGFQLTKVVLFVDAIDTEAGTDCPVPFKLRNPVTEESCQTNDLNPNASWVPNYSLELSPINTTYFTESLELAPCKNFHIIGKNLHYNFVVDCSLHPDGLKLGVFSFVFGDYNAWFQKNNQRFKEEENYLWFNLTCIYKNYLDDK